MKVSEASSISRGANHNFRMQNPDGRHRYEYGRDRDDAGAGEKWAAHEGWNPGNADISIA